MDHNQTITFLIDHLNYLKWKQENPHKKIDFMMGHSLGEINALVASESISFSEAMSLIKERNIEMNKVKSGKMMAVLGLTVNQTEELLIEAHLDDGITVSVHNDYTYHCLSYPIEKEKESISALKQKKAHVLLIPHLGPFHSKLMDEAQW